MGSNIKNALVRVTRLAFIGVRWLATPKSEVYVKLLRENYADFGKKITAFTKYLLVVWEFNQTLAPATKVRAIATSHPCLHVKVIPLAVIRQCSLVAKGASSAILCCHAIASSLQQVMILAS